MPSSDDDSYSELTEKGKNRWRAVESDITAIGKAFNNGTTTPDDVDPARSKAMAAHTARQRIRATVGIGRPAVLPQLRIPSKVIAQRDLPHSTYGSC